MEPFSWLEGDACWANAVGRVLASPQTAAALKNSRRFIVSLTILARPETTYNARGVPCELGRFSSLIDGC
jgi:hypothetical protein